MSSDDHADKPDGLIKEFWDAWQAQADGAPAPSNPAIDPSAMARLTPHLMVLDAAPEGLRARLVGARHQQIVDACHAGALLEGFDKDHAERARVAVKTRKPVYWRADSATAVGDFPFASDGKNVDRVVSVVSVKKN